MKELKFDIIDDGKLENDENIIITLINVTLTHMENRSTLDLSEEVRKRLIWSMTEARITILDNDSMFLGSLCIYSNISIYFSHYRTIACWYRSDIYISHIYYRHPWGTTMTKL